MNKTAAFILFAGGFGLIGLWFYLTQKPAPQPDLQPPGTPGATDQNLDPELNSGTGAAVLSGQGGF